MTEYKKGNITLLNEDAFDVLPDLGKFDYLVTDPPYTVGGTSAMTTADSMRKVANMMRFMTHSFINIILQRIEWNPVCAAWIMSTWRHVSYISAVLEINGFGNLQGLVWSKNTCAKSTFYLPDFETVNYGCRGTFRDLCGPRTCGRTTRKIDTVNPIHRTHPFEKPPELVRELCGNFRPGRMIDPFMGTGGLVLGAAQLGWDCVGIELDTEHYEIACKRLDNFRVQPVFDFFGEEPETEGEDVELAVAML